MKNKERNEGKGEKRNGGGVKERRGIVVKERRENREINEEGWLKEERMAKGEKEDPRYNGD